MEKLLISACLVGEKTTYKGTDNYNPDVELLKEHFDLVLICPEVFGGLKTPRTPSEIEPCEDNKKGKRVITKNGKDVTDLFNKGAEKALLAANYFNIKLAVLKEESPSCGVHKIHNGYFLNVTKPGEGITTRLLKEKGIKVYNENEIKLLLKERGYFNTLSQNNDSK